MQVITIAPLPNQSFTSVLNEENYNIVIKAIPDGMSISIARENIWLVQNLRITPGTLLLPYLYQESGNFILLTENEELPDYTKFNITQQLIYYTVEEINAANAKAVTEARSFAPTLSFNFRDVPSLTSPQGFDITFTRASVGSYYNDEGLLVKAANDIPRFDHNPETLDSLGLLREGLAINSAIYSEDFSNAAWSKTNASVVANAVVAPDGTSTGDELNDNVTNGEHTASSLTPLNYTISNIYTFSVFAKVNERTCMRLALPTARFGSTFCFFNLQTGDMGTPTNCTPRIEELPGGWYRCSITATASSTGTGSPSIATALDLTNASYAGDGGGILVWGAQNEDNQRSSYIPTVAVAVTRAAESATLLTSGWLADEIGTLYSEILLPFSGPALQRTIAELSDGTANNVLTHYVNGAGTNQSSSVLKDTGVNQFQYLGANYPFGVPSKMATAYHLNSVTAAVDGVLSPTDDTADIPDFTTLYIGGNTANDRPLNGWIAEIQYFPEHLRNPVLKGQTE